MIRPSPRATLLALCVAVTTAPAPAADPIVWRSDYPTARKEAEQKNLPLLVVIGTEQCTYCRKMENVTFTDADTVALVAGKFVALKIDANKEPDFARTMRVSVYPTTVIAGSDGKIYAYLSGYLGPDQFGENARKAMALMTPASEKADPRAAAVASTSSKLDLKAAAPVKATGPADAPTAQSPAKELLAAATAAYKGERYGECLEKCEAIRLNSPGTPEAAEAATLLASIRSDEDKLLRATDQVDEKYAATQFALAEGWAAKGKWREAVAGYEKAIKAAPYGRYAESAQTRLARLLRDHPTVRAER